MVTSYVRESYLLVLYLLSCNLIIHGKLVGFVGNSHYMGEDNCPRALPDIQSLLGNWRNIVQTIPIPPTIGLYFYQ